MKSETIFLRLFYLIIILAVGNRLPAYINIINISKENAVWFVVPFADIEHIGLIVLALLLCVCIVLSINPYSRKLRFLAAILFSLFLGIFYSNGKVDNSSHFLLFLCVTISFFKSSNIWKAVDLSLGYLFSTYFLSGLWKFYELIFAFRKDPTIRTISDFTNNAISYSLAERGNSGNILQIFIFENPKFAALLFLTVCILQLSFFMPVINRKLIRVFLYLAIIFHLVNQVLVSVFFTSHFILILLVLAFYQKDNIIKDDKN